MAGDGHPGNALVAQQAAQMPPIEQFPHPSHVCPDVQDDFGSWPLGMGKQVPNAPL